MNQLETAINHLNNNDNVKFRDTIGDVLAAKINASIDDEKIRVASTLFNSEESMEDEEV